MTHATRDAIEHGVMALEGAIAETRGASGISLLELEVARDELQKLLDTGLDADLAALRERCATVTETVWFSATKTVLKRTVGNNYAKAIRALPLRPPDDPYEPKSVMHGDQEAT